MAFLKINGVTIPVRQDTFRQNPIEIGHRARAYDGSYFVSRQSIKNHWVGETPLLPVADADALAGIINGVGQLWPGNGALNSSSGTVPVSSSGVIHESTTAADGDVSEERAATEFTFATMAKYGTAALGYYPARTNLLTSDQATAENAPTGYNAGAATALSADTSNYWQGSKSLKAVLSDQGGSPSYWRVRTGPVTGDAGDKFVGTVWVKGGSGGERIAAGIYNSSAPAFGPRRWITIPQANTWYRLQTGVYTIPTTGHQLYLSIRDEGHSSYTLYFDGFQVEKAPYVSPWRNGAGAVSIHQYDYGILRPTANLTFAAWVKMSGDWDTGVFRRMVTAFPSSVLTDYRFSVYRIDGTDDIVFVTRDDDGLNLDSPSYTSGIWDWGWHHVAAAMNHNPPSGQSKKELYIDGVKVASSNPAGLPLFQNAGSGSSVTIGAATIAGAQSLGGTMDQIMLVPYAMTADAIAELAAETSPVGELPISLMTGDCLAGGEVSVVGEAKSRRHVLTASGPRVALAFELNEA